MKNLLSTAELYFNFIDSNKEFLEPSYVERLLADAIVNYWRALLFVPAEGADNDDAAKAEENLIYTIMTDFSTVEKIALQQAAQSQLKQRFGQETIDPEHEEHNREQRFLTFIATGRFEDMDLL